jgi:Icc-related predicted phosphoesterase
MRECYFVSDLHGRTSRYQSLFFRIEQDRPQAVFLGGDLFPGLSGFSGEDFLDDFIIPGLQRLKEQLGNDYPRIFLILGNDDSKLHEERLLEAPEEGLLWEYLHNRSSAFGDYRVIGYNYVPPTPFLNKDWERYDVSRFVDPGSTAPEDGWRTVEEPLNHIQYATIREDLQNLAQEEDLSRSIFLFHTPPYQTALDRAALDGKKVDHVPLDVNVGSIAVRKFILERQPLLTLHGHVHESARLTGSWKDHLGETLCLSAAHEGPELALVKFTLDPLQECGRELIAP